VVYEMPDDEPISGFEEKFEFAIYQSLTNAGYKLRKDAKVKLEIVVDELSTGEVIAISSGIESDLPKHMSHMPIDRFKETERFNVPKVKLKCDWSLQDASGKAFHKDDFSIGFPPNSELKFTDRDGLITFARQWQWKKLLENMNQQFDSEYHQFDLLVATFDSGPGQTRLAEAKKMRSEKSLAEHAAKRAVANEARDRERKARDLINARRDFLRAKSDRDTLVLKESSSHAAWKFTASQLEDMDVRAGQTIQVASKDDFGADEIRFATINTAQVAVLNRERKSRARRVDRFDLKKEKRLASTPVEKYSKLLDVRPDGKVWMVTKDRDKKVVQVYQATSGASDKLAAELDLSAGGSIENAWFTGRKTMLTWTGKICAGYQLPSGKQVFELEAGESTISARDFQPVLSSDRQYFIHKGREGLEVRKSSDGSLAGELKTFVLPSRITAMALLNDSKRLAVLTEKAVEIFDMQSGQPLQQICIEKLRGQMEWLQEDLILVGHQAISLKTGAIVWQYGSSFKPPFLKPAPGVGWVASQSDKAITRANVPTAKGSTDSSGRW